MKFWQPGRLFRGTPIGFLQSLTLIKNKQKWSSSKKCSFQQKSLGHEDCSFDKSNEKNSTKRPIVLAQCPKKQNVRKTNNMFFRSLFSSKSCNGQVESTTDYPAGKVLSNGQKFVAQSSTRMKEVIIFSFFSTKYSVGRVKMKYWLPGQNFHDQGWFFSVNC